MVQRYSVSVSDELAEKIEKYKKRLSVSKVFQEAMEERVRKEEEFERRMEEDEELEQVIERLREEKEKLTKDWFDYGAQKGFELAKRLSYKDLMAALELVPIQFRPTKSKRKTSKLYKWENIKKREGPEGILGMLFTTENSPLNENDLEMMTDSEDKEYLSEEGSLFVRGCIQGIRDFWDHIKDKI